MKPGACTTEWTKVDTVLSAKTGNITRSLAQYHFCRLKQSLFPRIHRNSRIHRKCIHVVAFNKERISERGARINK